MSDPIKTVAPSQIDRPEPNKVGRPSEYNPAFHPVEFIKQSNQGLTVTQIASAWGLHKATLYDWAKRHPQFLDAMSLGKQLSETWYENVGRSAMFGQAKVDGKNVQVHLGFYKWITANKFGWSDNIKTEHSGDIGQGGTTRQVAMVRMLEDPVSRDLALQLAERMAAQDAEIKQIEGEKNGQDQNAGSSEGLDGGSSS